MIEPPEDRRSPLTPQLALRVAIMGSFALAMFAIIFFRLWFLQVLSGDQYAQAANSNRVRSIAIPAPRGRILDRSGNVLVDSVSVPAVVISPPDLPVPMSTSILRDPPPADQRVYDRLAKVLGKSTRPGRCDIAGQAPARLSSIACTVSHDWALLPYSTVSIDEGVSTDVQDYLLERQDQFPGVTVEQVWLRKYPYGSLAAQLFGTVGPINPQEVKMARFKGVPQSDIVGQSGLEWAYDQYLRGIDGAERVQVDALGNFRGDLSETQPTPGNSLKLSLDYRLQQVGEASLEHSIQLNYGDGGAFVAMDPDSGEVYAMGSLPSFDPSVFTRPMTTAQYNQLFGPGAGFPQLNRAIQSAGPTGSAFKPITAIAALSSGAWSPSETFDDTGRFCVSGQCRHNAGDAVDGVLDLVDAIRVSSDDFFYNLGALTNTDPYKHPYGGALQHWAHAFGIGEPTGIDLGGEVAGNLPSPHWREQVNQEEAECDNATGPFAYTNGKETSAVMHPGWHRSSTHPPGGCGIADGTNRPWSIGDNESLAIGQGDVQVTPLQLATAYAALANGGTIVRPHLGLEIDSPDGSLLTRIAPPAVRHLNINPLYLEIVRQGLREAASQSGGTSDDVMGNFPEQVYGKTGTAQYNNQPDYSWYACFVPDSATGTPIVVVVTVEQGGFGDVAAAPVARQILSQWFFGHPGPFISGTSHTL